VRTIRQGLVQTIGGNGNGGSGGDTGLLSAATFAGPTAVLPFQQGIFIADNDRIRFANLGGSPETVAGVTVDPLHVDSVVGANGNGFSGDGGPARAAQMSIGGGNGRSIGMAIQDGALWFSDHDNNRIRRLDLATGIITTALGSGSGGTHAVGHPTGLAFHDGWLYWAQLDGNILRRTSLTTGVIEVLAGDGPSSYYGDGGPAADAELVSPQGVVIDADGVVFVADGSHRVRRIAPPALQKDR
jgi:sugar lactone lactonase YvrE